MKKLSETQQFTLEAVVYATKHGQDAYLETGRYKAFSTNTIESLERRGLIKVTDIWSDGRAPIYYARPLPFAGGES